MIERKIRNSAIGIFNLSCYRFIICISHVTVTTPFFWNFVKSALTFYTDIHESSYIGKEKIVAPNTVLFFKLLKLCRLPLPKCRDPNTGLFPKCHARTKVGNSILILYYEYWNIINVILLKQSIMFTNDIEIVVRISMLC